MLFPLRFLCLSVVLSITSSLAAAITSTPTVPPTQDPFYTGPDGWQERAPGSILRTRQFATDSTPITGAAAIYQFLYRSTNVYGIPNHEVVTVWVPSTRNRQTTKHIAYSLAYDSSYVNCDASYDVQKGKGPPYGTIDGSTDAATIQKLLDLGYYISTSDYEGPRAAYTNGVQSAHGLLDSIRAVTNSGKATGISKSARTVLWGYSGGALASEWASELHASYAPDVNIVGAALGGLTPNISSVALTVNRTPFVGLVPSGILGLAKQFPNLTEYLNKTLQPAKAATFYGARKACLATNIAQFYNQDIFSYSKHGQAILTDPVPASIIASVGVMGYHGVPKFPVFVYKGAKDQISPVADTDKLVSILCGKGAVVQYNRDKNNDHLTMTGAGMPEAMAFTVSALAGTFGLKACKTVITNLPT